MIYAPAVLAVRAAVGDGAPCRARTSPAGGSWGTCPASCPTAAAPCSTASAWDEPRVFGEIRAPGRGGRGRDGPGLQPGDRDGAGRRRRGRRRRRWRRSRATGQAAARDRRGRRRTAPACASRERRGHVAGAAGAPARRTRSSGATSRSSPAARARWFIDSKQTVCRPEAMVLVADAVLSRGPARGDRHRRADHGRRPGRLRHRRRGGDTGPRAQGVQRAQGGQGPRRRRPHRRRARPGRQGGGHRGHGHPGHLAARGGPRRPGRRVPRSSCWWRSSTAAAPSRPWRRPRASRSGPS